ncbi:MAG: TauD/TfdA family dioxygenase [Actinomycetota bacterium]|nr:TauD/TfdA family dioxygenase [Actinomycetota bacterium]MDQ2956659.1 TauD/TfdA family dioxygenase [Actinomycetota bacterium]
MQPPILEAGSTDLDSWLIEHAGRLETLLADAGAVIVRGLDLTDLVQFRLLAQRICSPLMSSNKEHRAVDGADDVQTPVEFPATEKLLWHTENSFNLEWPTRLAFGCQTRAERGGDTPTVDGRAVLAGMSPELRDRFTAHGITYLRRLGLDVGLDWRQLYLTEDRRQVEELCRASDTEFEWSADGEMLTTWQTRPAVVRHPGTGEPVWVGQPLHWHPAALTGTLRHDLAELYGEQNLPRTCVLGNGDPIPDAFIEDLIALCAQHEDTVPWQTGDVMVVDNLLRAHARNPYQGERTLLVAVGAPIDCRLLAPCVVA